MTVTIKFTEAVTISGIDALSAPNASVSHLSSTDGLTWTALLTASGPNTSSGNAVSVDLSKVSDLAGNLGSGTFASGGYKVDTVHPTVAEFKLDGATVSSGHDVGFSIKFSEAVKALDPKVFSAPLASVTGLHSDDGGVTWTGALTAPAGTTGSGAATAATAYDVDTQGPSATITLSGTELKYGETIGFTIRLSDKLDALPAGALAAPNADIGDDLHTTDGGLTWVGTLNPAGHLAADTNAVSLDLSTLKDANGNAGVVSHSANYVVDTVVAAHVDAGIEISDLYGPRDDDYVSANSSQHISGFLSEALAEGQHLVLKVDGKVIPASLDGTSWSTGETPLTLEDGVHTISATVQDDAGHSSATLTQPITIDTTAPVMLTSPDGASVKVGDALVFTFNEAMYPISGEGYSEVILRAGDGTQTGIDILAGDMSADRKTLTLSAAETNLQAARTTPSPCRKP